MKYEEHCKECVDKLGFHWSVVHRWLDAFAGTPKYGMKHRKVRHNLEGIKKCREYFGEGADDAARLHIIADLKMDGWKESDGIPRNEEEYVDMGLF